MPIRAAFVGQLTEFPSPTRDDGTLFQLKRFGPREVMIYRNANSQVRYIMGDDDEKVITEKDYPMGDMQLTVVTLGLGDWNLTDESNTAIPITKENILTYLDPEEITAINDKVFEINPALKGESTRKKS